MMLAKCIDRVREGSVTFTSGGATSLLNQLNPAPTTPSPLPSRISLVNPLGDITPSRPIILAASVKGSNPTGTVSFASSGVALGTGRNGQSLARQGHQDIAGDLRVAR